ncbi:Clan SC, family S9, unassigned serine peptidase [Tritrichomonas foetus]|uniref:Clan SC, family S9, unassigned serine peptidase n=1 Tax=Tritrichomonas foetus TaxID=1144522 RepID=A0A1J4KSQ8_9EUKA|nr:Clan SC, family S9, unassigned serine peptidase [Tritrichomonas foetus]|eukprot:OHT14138.1 Clan SC, family S9, unassigned serine peptidase [Tritrichomonas foetus]
MATPTGEQMSNIIIRPMRANYSSGSLMKQLRAKNSEATTLRESFEVKNKNGITIEGSIFRAVNPVEGNPIVIYSHGNAGNQTEFIFSYLYYYPFHGISICGFDFSGCGNNKEEYITMGNREPDDLNCVIDHMKSLGFGKICLYGRSMGAFTTTIVMSERSDILCGVLDSPYATLKRFLLYNIHQNEELYQKIRECIQTKVGYDIETVTAVDKANKITIPVLTFAGKDDTIVDPADGEEIYQQISSEKKEYVSFEGDHNSFRPQEVQKKVINFICENLGISSFSDEFI